MFGKKQWYKVAFVWANGSLESSMQIQAKDSKEALREAKSHIGVPRSAKGTWRVKRA